MADKALVRRRLRMKANALWIEQKGVSDAAGWTHFFFVLFLHDTSQFSLAEAVSAEEIKKRVL
eukprot:CAMPEP_0197432002 /NCGR_PEP_ID=MMETSP1175-20131217/146_1 /TAXON_ID=1003142 /ORGANISM="Triceratium dubium, Strain CCMP147" /LENGTH=62 /DNA_ID=CAMNT_0042959985 /DNA_START=28 /DNA_END=214 /DNA_ORIENTATION=-